MNNDTVKKNIARMRAKSEISQTEMAARLGMSRNAYRSIEQGKTQIINHNLERIAEALNKSQEELLLGYQPNEKSSKRVRDIEMEFQDREKQTQADYQRQLVALTEQIKALQDAVEAQKETIRTKDEIIAILKKGV